VKEMLELAYAIETMGDNGEDGVRLAELVVALDEWIRKGGFLPYRWRYPEK
jgi:hypothetical protein